MSRVANYAQIKSAPVGDRAFADHGYEGHQPEEQKTAMWPQRMGLLVQALLGLESDAFERVVRLRPLLPQWLSRISVRRLRVGGSSVDFDVLRKCRGIFLDERTALGRTEPTEFPCARELYCAPTHEEAVERGGKAIYQFYKDTYLQWPHPTSARRSGG